LRFPRPVTALVAIGTAAVAIGLSAVPASADQVRGEEWWLSSLSVTDAWVASQGYGVTVAVLSDGIDSSQPDLAGVATAAPPISGAPVADGLYLGEQGTAIASLIAGRGHGEGGGSGVIGVAPEASILSVAVTLPPDDPQIGVPAVAATIPAAIATGIRYAVDHGASVIDLPIDPGQPTDGNSGAFGAAGGSSAEQSAVTYALAHNVVLVAPAGDNSLAGDATNYPAGYAGVIAVGAFDSQFDKAPWTSHQSYVTLTAAGAGVVAASNTGGYQTMNSTSAASAVVAGIVALIRSRYPELSVANVRKALISTTMYSRPGGQADGSGYGAVDAAKALAAAAALATPPAARAASGAQPLTVPSPAAAGAGAQGMGSQILRAAEISVALLVLLLLVTAGYAATGRRRPRRLPAVTAQWVAGQAQSRYPHRGHNEADRMPEYFAAPLPAPGQAAGQLARPPATAALTAGSWLGDEDLFARAEPTGDAGGWIPYGPASHAISRRPVVSGAPPWEPASPPDGELPWTAAPGRQTVPGQVVAYGYPAVEQAASENPPVEAFPSSPRWQSDWPSGPFSVPPDWADRTDWPSPAVPIDEPDSTARTDTGPLPSWYRPDVPARAPADESPADAALADAAQATGPHDWPRPEDRSTVSPAGSLTPGQHRSGLPIRQPRPVTPAPLSPTGSLWEPAESSASLWQRPAPAAGPAGFTDPDGQPIYSWDPPPAAESRTGQPGELTETTDERSAPDYPHYPEY